MAGHARLAVLVVSAMTIGGAIASIPVTDVALITASENACGTRYLCPAAPAADGGDQATAEQRIIDGYVAKQAGCTPDVAADPQSVSWNPPGFTPNVGGSGSVMDKDPQLGGDFVAHYVNGRWHIDYQYC